MGKSAPKPLVEHINIAELNRGQSSKIVKHISEEDITALIMKNGKPMAFIMSYERYKRMHEKGIDIDEY
ncbi:MAG: type II toxin-antitoxin system Phd/YefM family antitoxin [Bacteroidaceae bacterium]|nr:type II toxin-antitoxin system Phd/YefM family antitoxin [Bacteroidaceae bacterium]